MTTFKWKKQVSLKYSSICFAHGKNNNEIPFFEYYINNNNSNRVSFSSPLLVHLPPEVSLLKASQVYKNQVRKDENFNKEEKESINSICLTSALPLKNNHPSFITTVIEEVVSLSPSDGLPHKKKSLFSTSASSSPPVFIYHRSKGEKDKTPKKSELNQTETRDKVQGKISNTNSFGSNSFLAMNQKEEYVLETFKRSNQDTCLIHKPAVSEGNWVQSGDLLTDCASSVGGELSLGQNLLIAYMPWEGYNFEDAILISERLVMDDLYTSVHIERYELETQQTKLGSEEITRHIPDVSEKELTHLDSFGIIKLGSWVEEGDILVGKITPINKKKISPYQKLLYTILEKQVRPIKDSSLRAPKGIKAKVIDIKYFLKSSTTNYSGIYHPFDESSSRLPVIAAPLFKKEGKASKVEASKEVVKEKALKKDPGLLTRTGKRGIFPPYHQKRSSVEGKLLVVGTSSVDYSAQNISLLGDISPLPPDILPLPKVEGGYPVVHKKINNMLLHSGFNNPSLLKAFITTTKNRRKRRLQKQSRKFKNSFKIQFKLFRSSFNFSVPSLTDRLLSTSFLIKKTVNFPRSHYFNRALLRYPPAVVTSVAKNPFKTIEGGPPPRLKKGWGISEALGMKTTRASDIRGYPLFSGEREKTIKTIPFLVVKGESSNVKKNADFVSPQEMKIQQKPFITRAQLNPLFSGKRSETISVFPFLFKGQRKSFSPELRTQLSVSIHKQRQLTEGKKGDTTLLKNMETIHIYLAEKRKVQVGDKMAGRHGNKGIVSKILPIQDMPYLPDGTPIDMVLNPLGVPSRMNVGQIYECLLGLAGKFLGENYKVPAFDEIYGPEASRSFVFNKLNEARSKTGLKWLFDPNSPGKIRLSDGRNGECFDQKVTVGQAYMLRLVHMVDDKIHMRSTGPYSLVTQQPLRGRSKQGGQRLGEMEVWALEGYGAAFTLLEMLTIKSDDMTGRMTLWSNLILNKDISIGTPESFKVLVCELQALCLDIGLFRYSESNTKNSKLREINNLINLP
uniref:DNA-directed RNA polymerase n=1 Tax=Chloromonas perforata TaxID=51730 RepID=A0A0S2LP37_9CHLO|nr:beta subunit of RNA polymerase [Chloromonas perforata]